MCIPCLNFKNERVFNSKENLLQKHPTRPSYHPLSHASLRILYRPLFLLKELCRAVPRRNLVIHEPIAIAQIECGKPCEESTLASVISINCFTISFPNLFHFRPTIAASKGVGTPTRKMNKPYWYQNSAMK